MFTLGTTINTPQGSGIIAGIGMTGPVEGEIIVRLSGGGVARFSGSALYTIEVA